MQQFEQPGAQRDAATERWRQAERRWSERPRAPIGELTDTELRAQLYELQIRQIELETQLDEARQAQANAESLAHQYAAISDALPDQIAVVQDIAARKRAETELRLSEFALSHASVGAYMIGADGRILKINRAACEMLGYSESELLGMTIPDIAPDLPPEAWSSHWQELRERKHLFAETHGRTKDGRVFPTEVELNFLAFEGREYNFAFVRDISKRKGAEEQLQEQRYLLTQSQRIGRIGSWSQDLTTNRVTFSEETYRLYGVSPDSFEPTLEAIIGLMHPDDRDALRQHMRAKTAGESPGPLTLRVPLPDGRMRILNGSGELIRDEQGRPARIIGTVQDITERKRAEDELRASEERMNLAVAGAALGVFHHDHDTDALYWSGTMRQILGWSSDEPASSAGYVELFDPADRAEVTAAIKRSHDPAGDGVLRLEQRIIRRDGSPRWINALSQTTFAGTGNERHPVRTSGILADITERKEQEDSLAAAQDVSRHLASVVESTDDAIISYDLDCIIRSWNSGARNVFGYSADEMIGQSINRLMPADRQYEPGEIISKIKRGERVVRLETVRIRKDGRRVDISATISPIYDAAGRVVGASKIARDVTELKQAEGRFRELQFEVARLDRLKALGEMVAGVAHELGQPLYAIKNFSTACRNTLALRPSNPDAMIVEWHEQICRAAELAGDVITRLRQFSLGATSDRHPIDLSAVIDETIGLLRFRLKEQGVSIDWQRSGEPFIVDADGMQIHQILVNLLQNAVDATSELAPDGRRIRISLMVEADQATVEVADSGIGIPEDLGKSVFEPFFSTKPGGLGLGLSISRSLVEAHRGELYYRANATGGTTFFLRLPRIAPQVGRT